MKENTYDIPAYKVGLVMIQNERNVPHESEDYEQAITEERVIFVPFEDVDGLSVKDVRRWLGINEVMLYFYCRYQAKSLGRNVIGHHQGTIFKPWFYIGEEVLDEREDMTIDKCIEQTMEELYGEMDEEQRKCIHCFFERYQDKTYRRTKQHIKRLQEQND